MISFGGDRKPTGLILYTYIGFPNIRDPFWDTAAHFLEGDYEKAWLLQTKKRVRNPIRISDTVFLVPHNIHKMKTLGGIHAACVRLVDTILTATDGCNNEVFIVPWAWGAFKPFSGVARHATTNHYQFYKKPDTLFVKKLIKEIPNV